MQLRNLQQTVDLLRQLIHRLKLTAKLRTQLAAVAAAPPDAGLWPSPVHTSGRNTCKEPNLLIQGSPCSVKA